VLVVVAVCVRLGLWQLDRLDQRRTYNRALRSAAALPALQLDSATLQAITRDPSGFLNRRVRVRGSFDPAGEVVLRGRAQNGRPGVHIATPLRLAGSNLAVVVNRGWTPSPDALSVNLVELREPGLRVVEGVLLAIPSGDGGPQPAGGAWLRLDMEALRERVTSPLLPMYVQQLSPPSTLESLERVPTPELDEGPHLSYAIQWFSFAAIALIGFVVVVRRRP
jgi:surfeit locus 1 family protein